MTQAVLEGVAFAIPVILLSSWATLASTSLPETKICGGGAKSPLWRKIIANVLGIQGKHHESEEGPGLGGHAGCRLPAESTLRWKKLLIRSSKSSTVAEPTLPSQLSMMQNMLNSGKFYPTVKDLYDTLKA